MGSTSKRSGSDWLMPGVSFGIGLSLCVTVSYVLPTLLRQATGPWGELAKAVGGIFMGWAVSRSWQNRMIEDQRREERSRTIEAFMGLRRLGLEGICLHRDSEIVDGATFDLLRRIDQFSPTQELVLIGFILSYPVDAACEQLKRLLQRQRRLKVTVCMLSPHSPCARLRSAEVYTDEMEVEDRIGRSIRRWQEIQRLFPDQITIRTIKGSLYGAFEGFDMDRPGKGVIYYTPIAYRRNQSITPSFVVRADKDAELFWVYRDVVRAIAEDASEAQEQARTEQADLGATMDPPQGQRE